MMHGPTPGVSLLVNADADSMEGIADYGVGVVTKASPRRAAIEEAQAELRQEYDVREQRRRELEFLEKGGNPLDFKSAYSASISIRSTSLADQLAEQYVTSETKGSFAMAASPQGDSIESSGRPGSVVCRNTDTDSMYDGDNSNLDSDINAKRKGKRGSAILLGQPSKIGSSSNAKEPDAAASFRVGAKGQAYARRNRSRTNRNSPNLVSTNQGLHHGNTNSVTITSYPRGTKVPLPEAHGEGCTVSTINNPKADILDGNIEANSETSHGHPDTVLDNTMIMDNMKLEADEMKITENKQNHDQNNHFEVADRAPNSVASQSSGIIGKDEALSVGVLESSGNNKGIVNDENINVSSVPESTMLHENLGQTTEIMTDNDKNQDFSINGTMNIEENSNWDQSLILRSKEILDRNLKDESSYPRSSIFQDGNDLKDSQLIALNVPANIDNESGSAHVETETELLSYKNDKQSATVPVPNIDCVKSNGEYTCEPRTEVDNSLSDPIAKDAGATASMLVSPIYETLKVTPPQENSESSKLQNSQQLELAKKMHEDAILKEALKIQANRKWAGELSGCYKTSEKRRKCHWDFVLEEMSWAANDFMQERLWKITAAAQVAKKIAYNSQATIEKFSMPRKQKKIARTLARAIMQFWHSAEVSRRSDGSPNGAHLECNSNMLNTWKTNGMDGEKDQGKSSTVSELSRPILRCAIQDYAIRFLKHQSRSADYSLLAVAPATPDRENDVGILELSSEDQLPEESLFYVVPHGAMQVYRDSIESQCVHYKKAGNTIHREDCELSLCGSVADGPRENAYEEDQGDTCTYILPGASSSGLSSKFTLKKKKLSHQKSYASKMYEVGNGMTYEPGLENKCGTEYFPLNGKRPSSAINVGSIPTKRLRTAARRVIPPYTSGLTSSMQVNSKTDVSSGETSSLQDDQSSLNGGSLTRRNVEVESAMDFDRQMQFDGSEVMKSKKKKKPKHLGYRNNLDDSSFLVAGKNSSYEHRLQVDRLVQDEHKDHAKRRLETQHFDSNGVAVSYGQHAAKKPKLLKQLPDTLPEVLTPATGSMPSPVASQMSNMSNSNKLMKIIANRDRGRKSKGLKMPAGYSGTGSQWSNFEDQALVVLVHDMGPNWELVSDAINSTLQFKCIFRKPKECKERHKFLMDKSAGDGADSAEDSGSSQPYPSTLPGIPKGSARQLFQRLQGPMEEDTLRTHFDKIISLNQQLHSCRRQEVKQVIPPHSSHVVALSQVCPNGGILTPLDLCESTASSPDLFSLGYQGSQSGGLAVSNHSGSMTPILPSGANTILQGSPGVALNSSLPTAPNPMSISPRDAQRYALPRPTALPVDDPQRMQQYSPMLPARNIQQSSMPLPGSFSVGVDRGVRMLAGGNGMGMMCAMPRSMPMPRTGFQGLGSAGMLNMVSASNMIPNGAHGMQNQVNVHPAAVSATGNSTLRPRDSLQILRPGQNTDAMMQELQLQVSQGNGQTVTPFNGMATSFSNATVASTLQTFPVQQNQGQMLGNSHQPHLQGANQTSSQQSYAIQQRKIQQRMMPQPHHSFSGAGAVSPVQNNPQVHSQNQSSSPVTAVPSSQVQNKQQNMSRNSQVSIQNQIMKQRQRQQPQQQQQQQPRQHQQQRQQSQQQAKLMKGGLGRGNTMLPPNLPGDASQINGPSTAPKSQVPEKHLMQQSQGFFPGSSSLNSSQTKMYPGSLPQSAKQMTPVSDASNQSPAQDPSNSHMVASQHTPVPSSVSLPGAHQQPQPRYMSQNQQTIQKMVQQNRQPEPNTRIQTTVDQMQVNPMTTSASVSQGTVLSTSAPMVSPATTWKPEPSYDKNTCSKIIQAPNSLAEIVGTDTLPSSSGQGMVPPQQFSGTVSLHGHGIGGQWQQTPQPQRQIRQTGQGELGTQNSNSAPG